MSTAQAHLSATQPKLSPWFIDFYVEPQFDMMLEKADRKRSKKKNARILSPKAEMSTNAMEMPEPMLRPEAIVETGATSVVFAIPGKNTITDNGEEHKVGISVFEFKADYQYNSVPKMSPFAFLTAKVKNISDFPMLAGKSNVFLSFF